MFNDWTGSIRRNLGFPASGSRVDISSEALARKTISHRLEPELEHARMCRGLERGIRMNRMRMVMLIKCRLTPIPLGWITLSLYLEPISYSIPEPCCLCLTIVAEWAFLCHAACEYNLAATLVRLPPGP